MTEEKMNEMTQFTEMKTFFENKLEELLTLARNNGLKTVGHMFFGKIPTEDFNEEKFKNFKDEYYTKIGKNVLNIPKIPKERRATAFVLFSRDERPRVKEENPTLGFGQVSKLLGVLWKEQNSEIKEKYLKMSKEYVKTEKKKRIYKPRPSKKSI